MADIAASVLARLKNKAAESGRSYQLCLQLFCQEEFLRRLEKSKYAENLVLKGGLFIYSLTDFDSRVTVDVDFLLRQMPNTPEQLKTVLEEIIATPTGNDFITFEIKDVAPMQGVADPRFFVCKMLFHCVVLPFIFIISKAFFTLFRLLFRLCSIKQVINLFMTKYFAEKFVIPVFRTQIFIFL